MTWGIYQSEHKIRIRNKFSKLNWLSSKSEELCEEIRDILEMEVEKIYSKCQKDKGPNEFQKQASMTVKERLRIKVSKRIQ